MLAMHCGLVLLLFVPTHLVYNVMVLPHYPGVVQGVHFEYILVYWACSFALMLAFVSQLVLCPCVL